MTLVEYHNRLVQWHITKHGRTEPDMVRTALKGCEEMGEIAKAVLKGDKENLKEEIADVFNILMHLARGVGVDIMELAEKKLLIIEERLKKAKPC